MTVEMVIRAFQFAGELDEVLVQLSPAAEIGDQVEEEPLQRSRYLVVHTGGKKAIGLGL
jgi:hypothetical protein